MFARVSSYIILSLMIVHVCTGLNMSHSEYKSHGGPDICNKSGFDTICSDNISGTTAVSCDNHYIRFNGVDILEKILACRNSGYVTKGCVYTYDGEFRTTGADYGICV